MLDEKKSKLENLQNPQRKGSGFPNSQQNMKEMKYYVCVEIEKK